MAAFAEIAKKLQLDTVELLMAAGKDVAAEATAAVQKVTTEATATVKKAAAAKYAHVLSEVKERAIVPALVFFLRCRKLVCRCNMHHDWGGPHERDAKAAVD